MSTPTKSKLYLLIIGMLLISNMALLFFYTEKKEEHKKDKRGDRGAMIKEFLQTAIGFNEQQLQQFDTLNIRHREKMKAAFDAVRINRMQHFKYLGANGFADSAIAAVINTSAEKQKVMELQMLQHFAAIRQICTLQQQIKFDSLCYKIWDKRKAP